MAQPPDVAWGLMRVLQADRRTVHRWGLAVIMTAIVARLGWAAWVAPTSWRSAPSTHPDMSGRLEH